MNPDTAQTSEIRGQGLILVEILDISDQFI